MPRAPALERDGFQVTNKIFINPSNTALLDPAMKRKVTISNLFANHRQSIGDIARILDEKYNHVINVLIEQGMIYERRKNRQEVKIERRGSLFRRH